MAVWLLKIAQMVAQELLHVVGRAARTETFFVARVHLDDFAAGPTRVMILQAEVLQLGAGRAHIDCF